MKKGLGNFKIRKGVFYPLCAIYLIVILLGVLCRKRSLLSKMASSA